MGLALNLLHCGNEYSIGRSFPLPTNPTKVFRNQNGKVQQLKLADLLVVWNPIDTNLVAFAFAFDDLALNCRDVVFDVNPSHLQIFVVMRRLTGVFGGVFDL